MTSEFIHEEISIMDYNGLSRTIIEGGGSRLAWMTGMDDEISIMDYNGLS